MFTTHTTDALQQLASHERQQLIAAIRQARKVYPGPIGELIAVELQAWSQFGYRFGGSSLMLAVVREIFSREAQCERTE